MIQKLKQKKKMMTWKLNCVCCQYCTSVLLVVVVVTVVVEDDDDDVVAVSVIVPILNDAKRSGTLRADFTS